MSDLNLVECVQGSKEWFESRIGMLTASRIADAISKPKRESTGELRARYNLRIELAVERITKKPAEHFVTAWMERGIELEPLARAAYELRGNVETDQVGFVLHPDRHGLLWAGCSPDGLVGTDGIVELKVPKPSTHAEYLLAEEVPQDYRNQMMWQMACCPGRTYNDFVSYCADFPAPLDLFVCRLFRNDERIAQMEAEAREFLAEVEAVTAQLSGQLAESLSAA